MKNTYYLMGSQSCFLAQRSLSQLLSRTNLSSKNWFSGEFSWLSGLLLPPMSVAHTTGPPKEEGVCFGFRRIEHYYEV